MLCVPDFKVHNQLAVVSSFAQNHLARSLKKLAHRAYICQRSKRGTAEVESLPRALSGVCKLCLFASSPRTCRCPGCRSAAAFCRAGLDSGALTKRIDMAVKSTKDRVIAAAVVGGSLLA